MTCKSATASAGAASPQRTSKADRRFGVPALFSYAAGTVIVAGTVTSMAVALTFMRPVAGGSSVVKGRGQEAAGRAGASSYRVTFEGNGNYKITWRLPDDSEDRVTTYSEDATMREILNSMGVAY